MNDIGLEMPVEVINNIGVLYFVLDKKTEAKRYFEEAHAMLVDAKNGGELNAEKRACLITVDFNVARTNEALCLFDIAESQYRQITKDYPSYADSIIRLGCLCRSRGDVQPASLLFKEAMSLDTNDPNPWTFIGNLHLANREYFPAQKVFERILLADKAKSPDAYSLVSLGNLWYEMATTTTEKDKQGIYMDRALNFYAKVLSTQPKNIYAANGMGCVIALKYGPAPAYEIFAQVREAVDDYLDVRVNIAHVYFAQRQYVTAFQMYKSCIAKFNRHHDVSLQMFTAHAAFKADRLTDARQHVEQAMIEAPHNLIVRYNHGIVLRQIGVYILGNIDATVKEVESALADLVIALSISRSVPWKFSHLSNIFGRPCAKTSRSLVEL
jgi:RNA polymerase-associated protein CTR9